MRLYSIDELPLKVLIIDPNNPLASPYVYLPAFYQISQIKTLEEASNQIGQAVPDFVMINLSYSSTKIIPFLDQLRQVSDLTLVPLVFVVDFTRKTYTLPGITWGGRIGLCHRYSSESEFRAMLNRLLGR